MMELKRELFKIIEYQNSLLSSKERIDADKIKELATNISDNIETKKYDFSNYDSISLRQNGKIRKVMQYQPWSTELIICIYLKRCIDRCFRVRYPNRNSQVHILFGVLSAVQDMKDYVIVKFDFEDFFNSISSQYIYERYIKNSNLNRRDKDILKAFVDSCPYCYAGINTSNVFSEIIARDFDTEIRTQFAGSGLIFYERYVDDGILVFNRYISESDCINVINSAITKIFLHDSTNIAYRCNTRLNTSKFKYISRRKMGDNPGCSYSFDFLGYEFSMCISKGAKKRPSILYGITQDKIEKYSSKIDVIVKEFKDKKDMNILRHKLKSFVSRIVYRRKRYSQMIWISKGFISNYNELRFHMSQLDEKTKLFLNNAVIDSFGRNNLSLPYFIESNPASSRYTLYFCLKNNKTLIFENSKQIGINLHTLRQMCSQVGVKNVEKKQYYALVREYLITVGVGH